MRSFKRGLLDPCRRRAVGEVCHRVRVEGRGSVGNGRTLATHFAGRLVGGGRRIGCGNVHLGINPFWKLLACEPPRVTDGIGPEAGGWGCRGPVLLHREGPRRRAHARQDGWRPVRLERGRAPAGAAGRRLDAGRRATFGRRLGARQSQRSGAARSGRRHGVEHRPARCDVLLANGPLHVLDLDSGERLCVLGRVEEDPRRLVLGQQGRQIEAPSAEGVMRARRAAMIASPSPLFDSWAAGFPKFGEETARFQIA